MNTSSSKTITAVAIGTGHRSVCYSSYALQHPDELKIVAVAEPNEGRRREFAKAHGLAPGQCFKTAQELASAGKLADAAINGTMDKLHVPTSLPLLAAGYDLLLEKPIATSRAELLKLRDTARRFKRKVMICHVLRYAPFYAKIRTQIAEGVLGDLLNIQTAEMVGYDHMATAFVRGKWRRSGDCGSSMLMAKCCHDMDVLVWLKSGIAPRRVSSFGGLKFFRRENAPTGSGRRCLVDCRIERDCMFSAKRLYVDTKWWGFYAWEPDELKTGRQPSRRQQMQSLRGSNPFGRCVWRCDNDVVDHQSVAIEFADGTTATHNMVGGASKAARTIHILGTRGEILGEMESGKVIVRRPNAPKSEHVEQTIDTSIRGDMHGGGDLRLVADFVRVLRGLGHSLSTTSLEDSIYGHLIGYAAEEARLSSKVVTIED